MKASLSIILKDGRRLGYQEYGHPEGYPVLYFHGLPSSRFEGSVTDAAARKRHVRILSIERPSFGISTFQNNRHVTDYPRDVKALVAHLGLDRFAIVGCSGGGPYALACAHLLPHGMVSSVGLLSSCGPCDQGLEDISVASRIGVYCAHWTPWALETVASRMVVAAKWFMSTRPVSHRVDKWLREQAEADRASSKEGEHVQRTLEEDRQHLMRLLFEGFAQGTQATIQEAQILTQHWGFELEDLDFSSIHIWHGAEDVNAPLGWIQKMAQRIPQSRLTVFPGESHNTVVGHLEWMFAELVPDSVPDQCA